jgi:hypothetical protein
MALRAMCRLRAHSSPFCSSSTHSSTDMHAGSVRHQNVGLILAIVTTLHKSGPVSFSCPSTTPLSLYIYTYSSLSILSIHP